VTHNKNWSSEVSKEGKVNKLQQRLDGRGQKTNKAIENVYVYSHAPLHIRRLNGLIQHKQRNVNDSNGVLFRVLTVNNRAEEETKESANLAITQLPVKMRKTVFLIYK
jgi:hypothetical protein